LTLLYFSCTEGSVAEVGLRPTDEKRTSLSRAHWQTWSLRVIEHKAEKFRQRQRERRRKHSRGWVDG